MPTEILAAVCHEKSGTLRLERLELADPGPGDVLVRVVATGICQTDVHARDGYFPTPYPAVYGHEGAGIVRAVGPGVTNVAPGDHVVMHAPSCGICANCNDGRPAYCVSHSQLKMNGTRADGRTVHSVDGAVVYGSFFQQSSFATYALATERNVATVRKDVPFEMLAAFPCGMNTGAGGVLNVLQPKPGDSFAVFGVGTVGLAGLMAARLSGCDPIIAVDVHANRLALARELGATHAIDAGRADPVAEIQRITGGWGVAASLEAAGSPAALRQAVDALRMPGTCCLVGSARRGVEVHLGMTTVQNGRSLRGCIQGESIPGTFIPRLVDWFHDGKLPAERLVTVYEFADINRAIADNLAGRTIKAVLRMPV